MKCKYGSALNDSPCCGIVAVVDLFPTNPELKYEVNGYSVHAMPICIAHLKDHINIFRAGLKGKLEDVIENTSREHLNEFDEDLS